MEARWKTRAHGGKMNGTKKTSRPPFGCYAGSIVIFILCLGSVWTAIFQSFPEWTPTPALNVETVFTDTVVSTSTVTLEARIIPSFTPALEIPSEPAQTSFLAAADSQISAVIPVTGLSCIPNNSPQTGKVVQVVDGDTIKVLLDQDGLTYSVRYIGMDTPENTSQVEYFGLEATAKNMELVNGKTVTLIRDVSETDRYGRLLRYVLAGDLFVNYELVAQGYANTVSYPPDISCIPMFQAAERQASDANLGLWGAPPVLAVVPTTSTSGDGTGGNAPCTCSGPDLDCQDFKTHTAAQACYVYCRDTGYGNTFKLDGNDNDGIACESLP